MTKTIKSISRIWFGWVGRRRPRTVVLLSVFVMMFILGVMLGGYTSVNEFKETYLTLNAKFLNTSDNLLITSFVMVYASATLFFATLGIFAGENLRWIPKEVMWPMLQALSFTFCVGWRPRPLRAGRKANPPCFCLFVPSSSIYSRLP